MNLPWNWQVTHWLSVTKLEPDGHGRTNVECRFANAALKPFVLNQDVSIVGADNLRSDIESMAVDLITSALELSQ